MKTITFYSYKGGVGRTLALCNVANRLAEFGKKVCIIDFDLEAPGVHLKYEDHIGFPGVKSGLVDYIHEFTALGRVPKKITDFVTPLIFEGDNPRADIALIAAGNTLIRDYWRKLSSINWNDLFYKENSVGVDFFYNLKEQIKDQLEPDFLLIDSRTGITDISGVTMSIFADEVVLLAANNKENLEGIGQVMKTLAIPANSIQNRVPKINFVLCRIPYFFSAKDKPKETNVKNNARKFLNDMLYEAHIDDLRLDKVLVIHSDPELEMQERFKISYDHDRHSENQVIPIGIDYLELFEDLTKDVISPAESAVFNNYLKVQLSIQKAIANPNALEKISELKSILNGHPESKVVMSFLAASYYEIGQYEEALLYIEEASKFGKALDTAHLNLQGSSYFFLKKYQEAILVLGEVLRGDPDNYNAIVGLSMTMYRLGNFEQALALQKRLLELDPGKESIWNDYANTLRALGRYDEAMEAIYHALEINPQSAASTGTLAEIHAAIGNHREFYKNLELSFSFGMKSKSFQDIIDHEKIYQQYFHDEKFRMIIDKYNIDVDLDVLRETN